MSNLKLQRGALFYSVALLLAVSAHLSCSHNKQRQDDAPIEVARGLNLDSNDGLTFRVGAVTDFEDAQNQPSADSTPLEQARANTLLANLPALPDAATLRAKIAPDSKAPKPAPNTYAKVTRKSEPFKLIGKNCTESSPCKMRQNLEMVFNHPVEARHSFQDLIKIEPVPPNLIIEQNEHNPLKLIIRGRTQPGTQYKVTIQPELTDALGQSLGQRIEQVFYFDDAQPAIYAPSDIIGVLDRDLNGHFPVLSMNLAELKVRAFRVQPEDWPAYLEFHQKMHGAWRQAATGGKNNTNSVQPPGELVFEKSLRIDGTPNQFQEDRLDLREALNKDGYGQILLILEPTSSKIVPVITWVQVSDMNVNAVFEQNQLVVRALSRVDGRGIEGVSFSLLDGPKTVQTSDAEGFASLALPVAPGRNHKIPPRNILIARQGNDIALLPESASEKAATTVNAFLGGGLGQIGLINNSAADSWSAYRSVWFAKPTHQGSARAVEQVDRFFTVQDKEIYFPGDTVSIKGWVRGVDESGAHLVQNPQKMLYYTVMGLGDPKLESVNLAKDSSFQIDVKLPDDPAKIHIQQLHVAFHTAPQASDPYIHKLQIGGLPDRNMPWVIRAPQGPFQVGQPIKLELRNTLEQNERLAGAAVQWTMRANEEAHFQPMGLEDYTFWRAEFPQAEPARLAFRKSQYSAQLNAAGAAQVSVNFERADPPVPMRVETKIQVTDINQNDWPIEMEPFIVFPAQNLVGIRAAKQPAKMGEKIAISAVVTDLAGTLISGRPAEIHAEKMEFQSPDDLPRVVQGSRQNCTWTSQKEPHTCQFEAKTPGLWRIRALTRDAADQPAMSQVFVEVQNPGAEQKPESGEEPRLELRADKEQYQPGDTARIHINAPFDNAYGLAFINNQGVLSQERFQIEGHTHTLDVKLGETDLSVASIYVELLAPQPRPSAPPLFLKASDKIGVAALPADPGLRVAMDISADTIHFNISDANGNPTSGATLVLAAAKTDTPHSIYQKLEPRIPQSHFTTQNTDDYLVSKLDDAAIEDIFKTAQDPLKTLLNVGGGVVKFESSQNRKSASKAQKVHDEALAKLWETYHRRSQLFRNFSVPMVHPRAHGLDRRALFERVIQTDDSGQASVALERSDLSASHLLRAIAVNGAEAFGEASGRLPSSDALAVRLLLPPMMPTGQALKVPVVIENRGDKTVTLEVVAQAVNMALDNDRARALTIGPSAHATLYFNARVGEVGEGVMQVGVSSAGQTYLARESALIGVAQVPDMPAQQESP